MANCKLCKGLGCTFDGFDWNDCLYCDGTGFEPKPLSGEQAVEIYPQDKISTIRSFLLRKSNHTLAEYPRPLTKEEAEVFIHPQYKNMPAPEHIKILYTHINQLSILAAAGYHIVLNQMFAEAVRLAQEMPLEEALAHPNITKIFEEGKLG